MANPGYLRSTDGSDPDNGSTWALANASMSGAIADAVAGDTIYVSQSHAETQTGTTVLTFPGTIASPNKIICGNDAAAPPTAVAATGSIANTNGSLDLRGSYYMRGVTLKGGGSGTSCPITLGQAGTGKQVLELCTIDFSTSNVSGSTIKIGSTASSTSNSTDLISTDLKFGHASQGMLIQGARFVWRGGSILSGGTAITTLVLNFGVNDNGPGIALIEGVDLSQMSSSANLLNSANVDQPGTLIFRNCKLPTSWSGSLTSATIALAGFRAEMHNCDSGDTNYRLWVEDYAGSIKSDTTNVRSGGASNGTTTLSWKMQSSADAEYPHQVLESVEIPFWVNSTGAKTATVEIMHDSVGSGSGSDLTNAEIWAGVQYLGTSGFPLGSFANNAKADVLAAAADHTNSSETWSDDLTTPVKQKLTVSFTVNEIGWAFLKVYLAKASSIVYVDPKVTVA
jgi:hypothetical protein